MEREPGAQHIGLEDLALLAEGRIPALQAERLYQHLAQCRTCTAAYADAARYRAVWLADPGAFTPPGELPETGLTVGPGERRAIESSSAATHRPFWRGRGARWAPAVGALVLVGLAVGTILSGDRTAIRPLPPAIRAAIEGASARGLVLPGGERGAAAEAPVYRSGGAASLSEDVAIAVRKYESGQRTAAAAYIAGAGLLVSGQLDNARGYAQEALRRHPDDYGLRILAADVAYRSSDLAKAEGHLRKALRIRPRDPVVALDLSIVLAESGQAGEAERLLRRVAERHRDVPIGERARRELARLELSGR